MIAADYLYTNYLCRIATILGGDVESAIDTSTKYISLEFARAEIYFRYNEDGFILENQYGEKSVHPIVESFLALLIHKALNIEGEDNDIKINGRKVEIDPRVIPLMGYLLRIYSNQIGDISVPHSLTFCSHSGSCPFVSVCKQGGETIIFDNLSMVRILEAGLEHLLYRTNIIFSIPMDRGNDTYMKILDNFFDFNDEWPDLSRRMNPWKDKLARIKMNIAKDVGYRKADVIVEMVLKKIIKDIDPIKASINTDEYGGYLVKCGEYVIPSDKVWKELFGREIEKHIIKFYEKAGYFKSRRDRK